MSEITRGVLGMPFKLAMGSEMSRRQFHACAQEVFVEKERLEDQVATLKAEPDSWQSGYDEGRKIGTKTALSERDQLKAENDSLRQRLAVPSDVLADCEALRLENEALRKDKSEPCDGCFMADAKSLRKKAEVLRYFIDAACQCSTEIDPRGYKWSEAYLDEALVSAHEVMSKEASHD